MKAGSSVCRGITRGPIQGARCQINIDRRLQGAKRGETAEDVVCVFISWCVLSSVFVRPFYPVLMTLKAILIIKT